MNEQILTEHGYKEFPKTPFCPEYAAKAYQKCVHNALGDKLYHINIYKYKAVPALYCPETYSATTQFSYNGRGRNEFMDITINGVESIIWLEMHLHNIWKLTAADTYERRDDE